MEEKIEFVENNKNGNGIVEILSIVNVHNLYARPRSYITYFTCVQTLAEIYDTKGLSLVSLEIYEVEK